MGQTHGLKSAASSAVEETASSSEPPLLNVWVAALTCQRVTTVLVPLLASETLTNLVLLGSLFRLPQQTNFCVFTKTKRELPSQSRVLFLLLHRGLQVIFSAAHKNQTHSTVYPDHLGFGAVVLPHGRVNALS